MGKKVESLQRQIDKTLKEGKKISKARVIIPMVFGTLLGIHHPYEKGLRFPPLKAGFLPLWLRFPPLKAGFRLEFSREFRAKVALFFH